MGPLHEGCIFLFCGAEIILKESFLFTSNSLVRIGTSLNSEIISSSFVLLYYFNVVEQESILSFCLKIQGWSRSQKRTKLNTRTGYWLRGKREQISDIRYLAFRLARYLQSVLWI